ncbi:MAG: MotA/TolQ/ExbB proton channel family protein, partial [Bradymonadaceae bacterium]
FFLPDGTKTEGKIVRVGHVAAYGISKKHAGALAPAGKGRLKLWKKPTADTARAVADGKSPGTLETFLFESLDKEVEQKAEEGWYQTVNNGGVVAWVIVALGLLGVLMVLARAVTLGWVGSNARRVVRDVTQQVADGDYGDALAYCENARGAASRILGTALGNITRDREEIEDLVSEAMMREAPRIERFGAAILVLAAVAPLLGLLGTVTGMISTFDIITEFGTGDPRMLSGGISEALITTQFGLAVAIPLLLVGNLLKGWAERIQGRLERGALRVVNLVDLGTTESADPEAAPADVPTPESDGGDRDTNSEALGAI